MRKTPCGLLKIYLVRNEEGMGSNPISSTIFSWAVLPTTGVVNRLRKLESARLLRETACFFDRWSVNA
jgi:hypothetical protein